MRAGAQALTLLGAPRNFLILRSLEESAKGRLDLRRDAGSPAQSTLRNHLNALEATGAIVKRRLNSFPGALEYELTDCGHELLTVAESIERWLAGGPEEPLELGSDRAKVAIKGLVDSWCATVLTCLAAEPLTLTELDKRISVAGYPAIERCLETMRFAEQLEIGTRGGRGTPYAVTEWLRRSVVPLMFAARWEHRNRADGAAPMRRVDIDGALQLVAPMLDIPPRVSGSCQLAAEAPNNERDGCLLGLLEVRSGRVALGSVHPRQAPDACVSGPIDSWFCTLIDAESEGMRITGARELPETVFDRVHHVLFAVRSAESPLQPGDRSRSVLK